VKEVQSRELVQSKGDVQGLQWGRPLRGGLGYMLRGAWMRGAGGKASRVWSSAMGGGSGSGSPPKQQTPTQDVSCCFLAAASTILPTHPPTHPNPLTLVLRQEVMAVEPKLYTR
jgi:hypothetical protein